MTAASVLLLAVALAPGPAPTAIRGAAASVTVSVLADDASTEKRAKYRQSAPEYLKQPVN